MLPDTCEFLYSYDKNYKIKFYDNFYNIINEFKLDNIKKLEELRLETIDECAEPLVNASKNLEVEPDTATLIDITELLKRKQEENL